MHNHQVLRWRRHQPFSTSDAEDEARSALEAQTINHTASLLNTPSEDDITSAPSAYKALSNVLPPEELNRIVSIQSGDAAFPSRSSNNGDPSTTDNLWAGIAIGIILYMAATPIFRLFRYYYVQYFFDGYPFQYQFVRDDSDCECDDSQRKPEHTIDVNVYDENYACADTCDNADKDAHVMTSMDNPKYNQRHLIVVQASTAAEASGASNGCDKADNLVCPHLTSEEQPYGQQTHPSTEIPPLCNTFTALLSTPSSSYNTMNMTSTTQSAAMASDFKKKRPLGAVRTLESNFQSTPSCSSDPRPDIGNPHAALARSVLCSTQLGANDHDVSTLSSFPPISPPIGVNGPKRKSLTLANVEGVAPFVPGVENPTTTHLRLSIKASLVFTEHSPETWTFFNLTQSAPPAYKPPKIAHRTHDYLVPLFGHFRLTEHAGLLFRGLREHFGIRLDELIHALNLEWSHHMSTGNSQSLFFEPMHGGSSFNSTGKASTAPRHRFMVKTMRGTELEDLLAFLPTYVHHMRTHTLPTPEGRITGSLLPVFWGCWTFERAQGLASALSTMPERFSVLGILDVHHPHTIIRQWDIKGSDRAGEHALSSEGLHLHTPSQLKLLELLDRDSKLLESWEFMDYSLLIGLTSTPTPFPHARKGQYYTFGIIDVLQKYNLTKWLERSLKRYSSRMSLQFEPQQVEASVEEPKRYRERLLGFIRGVMVG